MLARDTGRSTTARPSSSRSRDRLCMTDKTCDVSSESAASQITRDSQLRAKILGASAALAKPSCRSCYWRCLLSWQYVFNSFILLTKRNRRFHHPSIKYALLNESHLVLSAESKIVWEVTLCLVQIIPFFYRASIKTLFALQFSFMQTFELKKKICKNQFKIVNKVIKEKEENLVDFPITLKIFSFQVFFYIEWKLFRWFSRNLVRIL